jgi:phosphodiesterase/alkaline phosphatase D-like protein
MALLFAGCKPNASVETGAASDITTESVVLHGVVNVDISQYDDVKFGMMVSENKAEFNTRDGDMYKAKLLIDKDFKLTLEGLSPDTKYYYCAWVFLNNTQYEFGAIKEFVTIKDADQATTVYNDYTNTQTDSIYNGTPQAIPELSTDEYKVDTLRPVTSDPIPDDQIYDPNEWYY